MANIKDQSFVSDDSNYGEFLSTSNYELIGVQFVPSVTASVSQIILRMQREGSPTGNIWAEIYSDNGDEPNAQIGADSEVVNAGTMATSWGAITFTFAAPIALVEGTKYWIVLNGNSADSDATNNTNWSSDSTTPVYSHKGFASWNGAAWTVAEGTTHTPSFEEWYDDTTIIISQRDSSAYFL